MGYYNPLLHASYTSTQSTWTLSKAGGEVSHAMSMLRQEVHPGSPLPYVQAVPQSLPRRLSSSYVINIQLLLFLFFKKRQTLGNA